MIKSAVYNIIAYQGATFTLDFTYKAGEIPVNLVGYTAAMQVRESPNSPTTVLSLESGDEITLGGSAGTISIEVSATVMTAVAAGNYQYDLELNSGSQVTRLLQGKFAIEAEVTR